MFGTIFFFLNREKCHFRCSALILNCAIVSSLKKSSVGYEDSLVLSGAQDEIV